MKSRVVVAAIIEKDGKILMGKRRKGVGPYPDTLQIPGGGVNMGEESLLDAIAREVREETGLEIHEFEPLGFADDHEKNKHGEMIHYIFLNFRAIAPTEKVKAQDDLVSLAWYPIAELGKLSLPRPSIALFRKVGLL